MSSESITDRSEALLQRFECIVCGFKWTSYQLKPEAQACGKCATWIQPLAAVVRRNGEGPGDYVCTACDQRMKRYSEFEEYQHDGCGGLVTLQPLEAPQNAVGSAQTNDAPPTTQSRTPHSRVRLEHSTRKRSPRVFRGTKAVFTFKGDVVGSADEIIEVEASTFDTSDPKPPPAKNYVSGKYKGTIKMTTIRHTATPSQEQAEDENGMADDFAYESPESKKHNGKPCSDPTCGWLPECAGNAGRLPPIMPALEWRCHACGMWFLTDAELDDHETDYCKGER